MSSTLPYHMSVGRTQWPVCSRCETYACIKYNYKCKCGNMDRVGFARTKRRNEEPFILYLFEAEQQFLKMPMYKPE